MSSPFNVMAAHPAAMTLRRAGSGIVRWTDDVASQPFLVQMLLSSRTDGEMTAMRAFMEPGTVTHWHSHPRGQILFVLDGVGLARREGGEPVELRAGDSVWFAPGERHWHGATPISPFSYLSVQPVGGDTAAHWFEPVSGAGERP